MLTSRASWFLLAVMLLLSVGLLRPLLPLTMIGLTLLVWFGAEWVWFLTRLDRIRGLRVEREVWDDKTAVATLWAGQKFVVRLRLTTNSRLPTPHLAAADHLPYCVEHLDGEVVRQGVVNQDAPLEWAYGIRCGPAGIARFEGVRIQCADEQGFFYHVHFVHAAIVLPILPVLTPLVGRLASKKRHNLLLPPGIHRFRRPGSGSELNDLRDYLPGDPPKTIAWKISARRDRLITKEFESEVPVRCTLFVDTSNSVRVLARSGAGAREVRYHKALDRLVDIAAGILQFNAGIRDLTGLCLFDEEGAQAVLPNRGSRHRTECLRLLAQAASRLPVQERIDPAHLLPVAYSFAREVYPELLRPAVNHVPSSMAWFEGFSRYSRRLHMGLLETLHRRKGELRTWCWWSSFWAVVLPTSLLVLRYVFKTWVPPSALVLVWLCPLLSFLLWIVSFLLLGVDAVVAGKRRLRDRRRKQLAAVLSVHHGLAPGGVAALLEDDDAFSRLVQRFLGEHQVPYTLPLYSLGGRYLFAAPAKVAVLAQALLRAVGRGRDNELFVLLADLLELDDALEPLLHAVRVALGRHHQVVVICAWPVDLDLPRVDAAPEPSALGKFHTGSRLLHAEFWDEMSTRRFHLAYHRLRRSFARLGVAVLCAAGGEPVSLILNRLERLRSLGRPHS
jgi:uncharacterized protein (DUF58 family)